MMGSRRQFLTTAGTALAMSLAGCSSQSTYQNALAEFNDQLDSPVFAYLSATGSYDSPPVLDVDVYQNKLPATIKLQRPSGETVDTARVTHESSQPLERSGVRTKSLNFDGEGKYELYGRGHRNITDTVQFRVNFTRELGIGRMVAVFHHL